MLGVTHDTVLNWEKCWTKPTAGRWPKIIEFLGYDPHPEPITLGGRLQAKYRVLGLSRKEASRRLGIDENTLKALEDGTRSPGQRCEEKLNRFLGS
jgi:DNA-binding transcriptional regulator YiaG